MSRTTVVIMTRDRRDDLARTLENTPDVPIVVVDNGSRDGTPASVRRLRPDATVLELGRNHGAAARNFGVEAATTPYVAFSDDDSWWAPGALSRAETAFDHHPRLGLVAGHTLVGPANTPDVINQELRDSPLGRAPDLPGPEVLGFLCCAAVVRRSAYRDVGGINPLLFFLGEEKLLAWDLAAAGWACCYLPDVVAHHHPSPGRGPGRRALQLRNELLTTWMRRRPRVGWSMAADFARLAVRDRDARRALVGAVRRLPAVRAVRKPLSKDLERRVDLIARGADPPPGTLGTTANGG